jgi:hypothetical protein
MVKNTLADHGISTSTAGMVKLNTSNFNLNLDTSITDVQKLAEKVNVMSTGGAGSPSSSKVRCGGL